jgi:hypothetical protein
LDELLTTCSQPRQELVRAAFLRRGAEAGSTRGIAKGDSNRFRDLHYVCEKVEFDSLEPRSGEVRQFKKRRLRNRGRNPLPHALATYPTNIAMPALEVVNIRNLRNPVFHDERKRHRCHALASFEAAPAYGRALWVTPQNHQFLSGRCACVATVSADVIVSAA